MRNDVRLGNRTNTNETNHVRPTRQPAASIIKYHIDRFFSLLLLQTFVAYQTHIKAKCGTLVHLQFTCYVHARSTCFAVLCTKATAA